MANPIIAGGISRFSRTSMYKRRGLYKREKSTTAKKVLVEKATKSVPVGGPKNGGSRDVLITKESKYYAAEDAPKPKTSRKRPSKQDVRKSIVPGSVLILLAGRFRGKRVVFLKQLESGLLLVTGPYKVNGVPLKRVNQAYVIATSTKVDIKSVDASKIGDDYFKKTKEERKGFFDSQAEKKALSEDKKTTQKSIDSTILKTISSDKILVKYLRSSFSLSKGQAPHLMKF